MYKGQRDPELHIIVPQIMCNSYIAKDGRLFVEIFIPPESIYDYQNPWGSIMVMTEQVDFSKDVFSKDRFNVVRVNDGAKIVCSIKDASRTVISSEILLPEYIMGRILKYHRYVQFYSDFMQRNCIDELNTNSLCFYDDMHHIGQSMEFYMNRIPKYL